MTPRRNRTRLLFAAAALAVPTPFALADPPLPTFGPNVYNITVSNPSINGGTPASTGSSDNSTAINAYVSYCSTHGGGTVEVPAGTFISGQINMLSNVNLQIDSSGILKDKDINTFLLKCSSGSNMQISGSGTIDGGATTTAGSTNLVDLRGVNTLAILGITIANAGHEHLVPENDTNVTISGITIHDDGTLAANGGNYLGNTDAIDYAGSHFLIKNCTIRCGDDDIVAKSASFACSDITINNCHIGAGHGISVGGGTSKGLNGLTVTSCDFTGTTNGLRLKAQDANTSNAGGGTLNPATNISYSNITMTNVANPIIIDSFYNGSNNFPASVTDSTHYPLSPAAIDSFTPIWSNVSFSNITATGSSNGGLIYSVNTFPLSTTGLTFSNVNITANSHMNLWYTDALDLSGLTVNVPGGDSFANAFPAKGVSLYALGQWIPTGGSSWATTSNWTNGIIPNAAGKTASFTSATSNSTVTLDGNRSVGMLSLNSNRSYAIAQGSSGSLTMDNGASTATIQSLLGSHTISAPVILNSNTQITLSYQNSSLNIPGNISGAGALTISSQSPGIGTTTGLSLTGTNSYLGATTLNAGLLTVTPSAISPTSPVIINAGEYRMTGASGGAYAPASLTINGSGLAHLTPGANKALVLSSLPTIAAGAQLDVEDNVMVINYGSDTTHATRDAIRNLLINGRNAAPAQAAPWNGSGGIISTYANQTGNGFNLAIGYADNTDLAAVRASGSYTTFGGQTVASNTVLVQLTRGADATLDGIVDGQDVAIIGTHFQKPGSGQWCFGDFDYSGTCDGNDVAVLGTTFGKTAPILSPAQMTAEFGAAFTSAFEAGQNANVPEPTILAGISLGAIAMSRMRSRTRRKH